MSVDNSSNPASSVEYWNSLEKPENVSVVAEKVICRNPAERIEQGIRETHRRS